MIVSYEVAGLFCDKWWPTLPEKPICLLFMTSKYLVVFYTPSKLYIIWIELNWNENITTEPKLHVSHKVAKFRDHNCQTSEINITKLLLNPKFKYYFKGKTCFFPYYP